MTLQELANKGFKEVIALSYGYMSTGIFSHYEPFSNLREITFDLLKFDNGLIILDHKWLFFLDEDNEDFYIEDGKAYVNDPELKEAPNDDDYL